MDDDEGMVFNKREVLGILDLGVHLGGWQAKWHVGTTRLGGQEEEESSYW